MSWFGFGKRDPKGDDPYAQSKIETQTQSRIDEFSPEVSYNDSNQFESVSDFLNNASFDASKLHPMAGLGGGIDYIFTEDQASRALPGTGHTALPSRGWSDDLCYGTGTTYLAGLTFGGTWGLYEGLRKGAPAPNFKIQLNTVLNSMTRRGPFVGNSVGVVAMMYNGINSMIGAYRGKHDFLNSTLAGAASGALFKSTAGLRSSGVSAVLCGGIATAWSFGKNYIFT